MRAMFTFLAVVATTATATAAPFLSVDFNCRTNPLTFPGFTGFVINSNISPATVQTNPTTRTIGPYRLTLSANGLNPGYTDRLNDLPTNQSAFTESGLLRDTVYSVDSSAQGRLDLRIENLPASNRVKVTVWSFDAFHGPVRASDWYANGVLVVADYRFTNTALPTSNEEYRFSFVATVSGAGELLIQGRRNPASVNVAGTPQRSVFLNAVQVEREPLEGVRAEAVGSELRVTFVVWPEPGSYEVEEYLGGQWRALAGVVYGAPVENRVTARFGRPGGQRFYRVRYGY